MKRAFLKSAVEIQKTGGLSLSCLYHLVIHHCSVTTSKTLLLKPLFLTLVVLSMCHLLQVMQCFQKSNQSLRTARQFKAVYGETVSKTLQALKLTSQLLYAKEKLVPITAFTTANLFVQNNLCISWLCCSVFLKFVCLFPPWKQVIIKRRLKKKKRSHLSVHIC